MKWFRGISFLAVILLVCSGCTGFRPTYPATFTPLPATPTQPLITLHPTNTPTPTAIVVTPTPRASALEIVWLVNPADHTVVGIDPYAKKIVETIPVEGVPRDIVTGEGGIWVVVTIGDQNSILMRIDPYSHLASSHIPAMDGEAVLVTSGDGFIWLSVARDYVFSQAAGGGVEYSRNGSVLQVDPNPSKITQTYDLSALAADVFAEGDTLWVLANRNTYSLINKINLTDQSMVTLPETRIILSDTQKYSHFTKLGDWLWMIPADEHSMYIDLVSPATGKPEDRLRVTNRIAETPSVITQDGTSLWVGLRGGNILQIDPETREKLAVIETGAVEFTDLFFGSGFLWAVDEENSQVYQIDPISGELLSTYGTGTEAGPRPTPTITPTINPDLIWVLCGDAFQTRLSVGETAVVNTDSHIPNRVRDEAGGDNPIIGYIEPGEAVRIVEGPICLSQWVWWKVTSLSTNLTGWTSEGDGTEYWLVPYEY